MKIDPVDLAYAEAGAAYLQRTTGHRSWARVLVGENAFICGRCNQRFVPDEELTAHHYSAACLTTAVK